MTIVSFEMFLIDRGVCDGYTIGQWQKYVSTASHDEFDEMYFILKGIMLHHKKWLTALLAYLYPDEWRNWCAYRKLIGAKP